MQRCEGGGEARTTAAARGRCSSSSTGNVYWAGWARGAREEAERTCRMLPARPVCRLPHLRDVRGQGSSRSERAGESRHDFTRRLVPLTLPLLGNNGLAPCMHCLMLCMMLCAWLCAQPTRRRHVPAAELSRMTALERSKNGRRARAALLRRRLGPRQESAHTSSRCGPATLAGTQRVARSSDGSHPGRGALTR